MTASHIAVGVCFFYVDESKVAQNLCVLFIILFVIFFQLSSGGIAFVIMGEIMTEKSLTVGILAFWCGNILISLVTAPLIHSLGGWLFIIFAIFCFLVRILCLTYNRVCSFMCSFLKKPEGLMRIKFHFSTQKVPLSPSRRSLTVISLSTTASSLTKHLKALPLRLSQKIR